MIPRIEGEAVWIRGARRVNGSLRIELRGGNAVQNEFTFGVWRPEERRVIAAWHLAVGLPNHSLGALEAMRDQAALMVALEIGLVPWPAKVDRNYTPGPIFVDSACQTFLKRGYREERDRQGLAPRLSEPLGPCADCGEPAAERHHVVRRADGGDDTDTVDLCKRCHHLRHRCGYNGPPVPISARIHLEILGYRVDDDVTLAEVVILDWPYRPKTAVVWRTDPKDVGSIVAATTSNEPERVRGVPRAVVLYAE